MQREWLREGVRFNFRIRPEGIALAALYALACWATRKLSLDQFYLPAGVRVAALLMCPPRLWVYLILGEYAYFAQMRYSMIEDFGLVWAISASVSLMPTVALITHLHARLLTVRFDVWLLSVAAMSAVAVTLFNVVLSYYLWPIPLPIPFATSLARYAIGDYLGILTVAPLAMFWIRRNSGQGWDRASLWPSVASILVMLALGLSATALPHAESGIKTSLQLSMALPAIALTCMHGWRGAAIAVPVLNLIIGLTTPVPTRLSFDHDTFVIQQILAVAGTALIALGSSITHHYHRYRAGEIDRRTAIERVKAAAEHVRTSHMASEMDLRERALSMRRLGEGIDHSLSEIAYFLKQHGNHSLATDLLRISVANSRQFRGQTSMVYPTALEHVGLYLTLQISGINEEWSETNRVATLRLDGDPCQLSVGLQLAAYRTLVEAVSLLLKHEPGQVGIRARCGRMKGYQGIFASVQLIDKGHHVSPPTSAMAIERLTGRTLAYSGTVQCRRNRIRIVLIEAPATSKTAISAQTLA